MLHTVSLKENHVFRRLYHRGATAGNRLLVVYCLRNGTGHSRLGLTVSAKLGHAVERNRMRRRLREIYRLHEAELLPGYDIVIVARSRAMEADFAELTRAFLTLAGRTGPAPMSRPVGAHPLLSEVYLAFPGSAGSSRLLEYGPRPSKNTAPFWGG
ncbi:MAG: ribonuclease P protein component [Oscillospiraceae bacterium]